MLIPGILVLLSCGTVMAGDKLAAEFVSPPDRVKPWVMLFWNSDFVNKEAISWEMAAYKRAGVNGLQIFPNYENVGGWGWAMSVKGTSTNRVQPLSEDWYECVRHTIREADRLGMQLCFHNEPGYSGAGGPWVSVEHSLRLLVERATAFDGPGKFDKALPSAGGLDYRDVAVMAYPVPEIKDTVFNPDKALNLTDRLDSKGMLNWTAPEGRWTIIRYGHISTGKKIHPASPTATGYECDKMSREAVLHHFEKGMIGRILALEPKLNGKTVVGVELDSYEGGASDWTPLFREEFRKRRGYDLLPWMPAWRGRTVVGSQLQSEKFRHDVKRTVAELCADVYYDEAAAFCHARNVKLYTEAYGTELWCPLTMAGRADVPQGEFWLPGTFGGGTSYVRLMASAAHTTGKNIVTAEAFTHAPPRDVWQLTPYDLKAEGDKAYCAGLNHTILTEASHQFWQDRAKPGMTFDGWGTPFSVNQTWWEPGRAWMEYEARCHYLLQQGLFVADVLILSPFPAKGVTIMDSPVGPHRNYNYDLCSEEVFLRDVRCKDGRITLGNMEYRVLQLLKSAQLRPQVMTKLAELVEQGAVVTGPKPVQSPGLEGGANSDRTVAEIADKLWAGAAVKRDGRGYGVQGQSTDNLLKEMGIPPDFEGPAEVIWIHRRSDEADIYFLSNQKAEPVSASLKFRSSGRLPELWDAVTGDIRLLPEYQESDGRSTIPLRFEPHQSWFVVFRSRSQNSASSAKATAAMEVRSQNVDKNFPETKPVVELSGAWDVQFDPKWGGPVQPVQLDKLVDWTIRPEPGIKYYSGTAVYRKAFDIPQSEIGNLKSEMFLDVGIVNKLAEITINGQPLGTLWCPPWRVAIPKGLLKAKSNSLVIKVTNTWVNRLIGDEQEPDDCEWSAPYPKPAFSRISTTRSLLKEPEWLANGTPRPSGGRFTFVTYKHLSASDKLQESGLLGPVRVLVEE